MKKQLIFSLLIVALAFIVSIWAYPLLPDTIASHWGASGEVNGFSLKENTFFIIPLISIALLVLFWVIPKIDPLGANIKKFESTYYSFCAFMLAFMLYIQLLIIGWNLGYNFNFLLMLLPAFAILYYFCAKLLENAKPNWFVGIRTPWTLSDERVWASTHALGARLFRASAIIVLVGIFFESQAIFFLIVPVLVSALVLVVFSFTEYLRLNPKKQKTSLVKKVSPNKIKRKSGKKSNKKRAKKRKQ